MAVSKRFEAKTVSTLAKNVNKFLGENNIKVVSKFEFNENEEGYSVDMIYEENK